MVFCLPPSAAGCKAKENLSGGSDNQEQESQNLKHCTCGGSGCWGNLASLGVPVSVWYIESGIGWELAKIDREGGGRVLEALSCSAIGVWALCSRQ